MCLELFDAKLSSTLCRNFFLFCKISFLASFCSRFTSSVLPRLNASCLLLSTSAMPFVTHGLLLGYVFTTLVGISISKQNLTYTVMVSTCSSREAPVSMTSQSVQWKQPLRVSVPSSDHTLVRLVTGLLLFNF